eukprot:1150443-Pelagomonas_calceolata.AAC.1
MEVEWLWLALSTPYPPCAPLYFLMDTGNWDLEVLKGKTVCAANVHGGKACPKRAFADTFKEGSAGNVVALSYHI